MQNMLRRYRRQVHVMRYGQLPGERVVQGSVCVCVWNRYSLQKGTGWNVRDCPMIAATLDLENSPKISMRIWVQFFEFCESQTFATVARLFVTIREYSRVFASIRSCCSTIRDGCTRREKTSKHGKNTSMTGSYIHMHVHAPCSIHCLPYMFETR